MSLTDLTPCPEPSAALLILLADMGPRSESEHAIRACRKRMIRRRSRLGVRQVVAIRRNAAEEQSRQEAINATLAVCLACGLCDWS